MLGFLQTREIVVFGFLFNVVEVVFFLDIVEIGFVFGVFVVAPAVGAVVDALVEVVVS